MKRVLLGLTVGAAGTFFGMSYFNPKTPQTIGLQEHQTVNAYIQHHHLKKMLKQRLMDGYMQLNKAFLDYGLNVKLEGFYFYDLYFEKDEINNNKITKGHCIFSPKQQLCGHPSIQHGGATATIADQNSGILAMLYSKQLVATADLFVKYLKPVKKGQLYVWSGEVQSRDGRKIYVKSTVKQLETGAVCAVSNVLMMTVNWQHKMGDVFHFLFKKEATSQQEQTQQQA